jgi:hypothetical protein
MYTEKGLYLTRKENNLFFTLEIKGPIIDFVSNCFAILKYINVMKAQMNEVNSI